MNRLRASLPAAVRQVKVARGEKALAGALTKSGDPVVGTRAALYLPGEELRRIPWEQVQQAEWDPDEEAFRVSEVGEWAEARPVHVLEISEPGRLLELVRERVTATVLLQRHVPVRDGVGFFVIARRPAVGSDELTWLVEFQEGLDPTAPEVRRLVTDAVARAKDEVGLG